MGIEAGLGFSQINLCSFPLSPRMTPGNRVSRTAVSAPGQAPSGMTCSAMELAAVVHCSNEEASTRIMACADVFPESVIDTMGRDSCLRMESHKPIFIKSDSTKTCRKEVVFSVLRRVRFCKCSDHSISPLNGFKRNQAPSLFLRTIESNFSSGVLWSHRSCPWLLSCVKRIVFSFGWKRARRAVPELARAGSIGLREMKSSTGVGPFLVR